MWKRIVLPLATLALVILFGSSSFAATLTVRQDGQGDFTTIGGALDASAEGDAVLVYPGTYYETFHDTPHSVFLRSTHGAAATIVIAAGDNRLFKFTHPEWVIVVGFTFRDGYSSDNSGSALAISGAGGYIKDCVFENGYGELSSGAAYFSQSVHMFVEDCVFRNNTSPTIGGACSVVKGSSVTFRGCTFEGNSSGTWGGALWVAAGAAASVTGCFFTGNEGKVGSCMYYYQAGGEITGNTFHKNIGTALVNDKGAVYLHQSSSVDFSLNIVTSEINGYGLVLHSSANAHYCNVYFDNEVGAVGWDPAALDPTESTEDPGYCNPDIGDFSVSLTGPAAPRNNACNKLIGAFRAGCGGRTGIDERAQRTGLIEEIVPNPFNPSTMIHFELPMERGPVRVAVYDIRGAEVDVLIDERLAAGPRTVEWNASRFASGVYFLRVDTPFASDTKKLVLVR